jgi:WD40 repeat protein
MKVLVGSTNGLIKTLDVEKKTTLALWGVQQADTNVECLDWALPSSEKQVIAGYEQGEVKIWDTATGDMIAQSSNYEGRIRGVFCYPKLTGRLVVACTHKGKLDVRNLQIKSEDAGSDTSLATRSLVGRDPHAQVMRMRHSPHAKEHIVVVGKKVEPQIWNFEHMESVWKAKPVARNFLRQEREVDNVDVQFLVADRNRLVTGTRQRLVRVYDTQISDRRPVLDVMVPHFEYSIISVGVTRHQPNSVFVTEGSGRMSRLDLRNGRLETVFRGAPGAVRGLAYHPTKALMATACLDRFVRVYDLKKPKLDNNRLGEFNMPYKVYGKQRLSSILFSEDESVEEKKAQQKRQKIDSLWDSLENLGTEDGGPNVDTKYGDDPCNGDNAIVEDSGASSGYGSDGDDDIIYDDDCIDDGKDASDSDGDSSEESSEADIYEKKITQRSFHKRKRGQSKTTNKKPKNHCANSKTSK